MARSCLILVAVFTRLIFGALTVVLIKVAYSTEGVGLSGEVEIFRRPIFMVFGFNVALLCLGLPSAALRLLAGRCPRPEATTPKVVDAGGCVDRFAGRSASGSDVADLEEDAPRCSVSSTTRTRSSRATSVVSSATARSILSLFSDDDELDRPQRSVTMLTVGTLMSVKLTPEAPYYKKALFTAIPSWIDLATQILSNYALLYLPATMVIMARGAGIVFTALLNKALLDRGQSTVQWYGIFLCCVGLSCGGVGGFVGTASDPGSNALGLGLALLSQFMGATQAVTEEALVKDYRLPPMETLGWEGFWGLLALGVLQPVLSLLPGSHGLVDSWVMVFSRRRLLLLFAGSLVAGSISILAALHITKLLSSVHRKLFNPTSGILVWLCGLTAYYVFHSRGMLAHPWTDSSYFEAGGYLLILLGLMAHGGLLCRSTAAAAEAAAVERSEGSSDSNASSSDELESSDNSGDSTEAEGVCDCDEPWTTPMRLGRRFCGKSPCSAA